mgnify:CR=1 FL=1
MALLAAADSGSISRCRQLLAAGSDVEESDPVTQHTPLHKAAILSHERIIQLLISHKADVNSRDRTEGTPLICASQEGHLASVLTLLQAGADPLLADNHGFLPDLRSPRKERTKILF